MSGQMFYSIYAGDTTDGKRYELLICPCGQQNTAGICSHIQNPLIELNQQNQPVRRQP